MFMSGAFEGSVRIEPALLGSEGLVEVCDGKLYNGRDLRGDLGEVHRYVS